MIPIFNLSDRALTEVEVWLLSKGLSFIPSSKPNDFQWNIELFRFGRTLRLNDFFKNDTPTEAIPMFRRKSRFDPLPNQSTIKTFLHQVKMEVNQTIKNHKSKHSNVSKLVREAIRKLSNDPSIVIRQADKGGAIVILNYSQYAQEMHSQLMDRTTYTPLPKDPTADIVSKFERSLRRGLLAVYIDEDLFQYLLKPYPRTPVIYGIPKIHKHLTSPPSRPIVSAVGGVIEPIAKWLDFLFKDPVKGIPTCIKDTKDFLQRIRAVTIDVNDLVFVTLDVRSLYTVIPHEGGIEAMRELLLNSDAYTGPFIEFVLELLEMALKYNYFRFEDKWYLQCMGMSMGAAMAPMYANAFMYKFEKENILDRFSDKIVDYFIFIDDIFIMWRRTIREAQEIETYINGLDTPIKVT
uniref:Reverse transcriptase domain-containing protein n=1 Tax=Leptobrachium leishanense TaxID=445787 RepID=A0A8C5M571_9ANUR